MQGFSNQNLCLQSEIVQVQSFEAGSFKTGDNSDPYACTYKDSKASEDACREPSDIDEFDENDQESAMNKSVGADGSKVRFA